MKYLRVLRPRSLTICARATYALAVRALAASALAACASRADTSTAQATTPPAGALDDPALQRQQADAGPAPDDGGGKRTQYFVELLLFQAHPGWPKNAGPESPVTATNLSRDPQITNLRSLHLLLDDGGKGSMSVGVADSSYGSSFHASATREGAENIRLDVDFQDDDALDPASSRQRRHLVVKDSFHLRSGQWVFGAVKASPAIAGERWMYATVVRTIHNQGDLQRIYQEKQREQRP